MAAVGGASPHFGQSFSFGEAYRMGVEGTVVALGMCHLFPCLFLSQDSWGQVAGKKND